MAKVVTNWDDLPLLMGVKETSRVTNYGPQRIRELCRAGKMPNVRWGRAFMIPKEALREWILRQAINK